MTNRHDERVLRAVLWFVNALGGTLRCAIITYHGASTPFDKTTNAVQLVHRGIHWKRSRWVPLVSSFRASRVTPLSTLAYVTYFFIYIHGLNSDARPTRRFPIRHNLYSRRLIFRIFLKLKSRGCQFFFQNSCRREIVERIEQMTFHCLLNIWKL